MPMQIDDFGKVALKKYTDTLADYNAKVKASKSVSSKEDFIESFMETDARFADINEKIEKLESALEDLLSKRLIEATPLVDSAYEEAVANSGVDMTALDEQLKLLTTTSKYLKQMYGEDVLEGIDPIERRRKKSGPSGESGTRRIRGFEIEVDGVLAEMPNAKGEMRSTFTAGAKACEVDVPTIQKAFFEAAGSEDTKADNFPAEVIFEVNDHKVIARKVAE